MSARDRAEPLLSFCIPTYNFAETLGQTLRSLLAADASADIEVVVVDGASTDHTAEVVERVRETDGRVRYIRREANHGVDEDLNHAVQAAQGQYCWLMSADDAVVPHALATVRAALQTGDDVYLCERIRCDRQLQPRAPQAWLRPDDETRPVFRFADRQQLARYLARALSLGAVFSYISSIIVRRRFWKTGRPDEIRDCKFAAAYALLSALLEGGTLRYLAEPLVLCRGDNDSFAQGGGLARFRIDIDGYHLLGETLFSSASDRSAFWRVLRREHPWYRLPSMRERCRDAQEWHALRDRLAEVGYTQPQLRVADAVGRHPLAVRLARRARHELRR